MVTFREDISAIADSLCRLENLLSAQLSARRNDNKLIRCHRMVDELLHWRDEGGVPEEAEWSKCDKLERKYRLHWVEAARMHGMFRTLPPHILISNADLFIKGQVPHTALDFKGSLETDKFAQLHFAAQLAKLGCEICGVENPNEADIVGKHRRRRFIVECKRPHSFVQLEQNIRKGHMQLLDRMQKNVVLILAVDCSCIVLERDISLVSHSHFSSVESYRKGMAAVLRISRACRKFAHPQICYLFDAQFAVPNKDTLMNFGRYQVLADVKGRNSCGFLNRLMKETKT